MYPSGGLVPIPIYDTPILPRENFKMALRGEDPLWIPTGQDLLAVDLACLPDNIARGGTFDIVPLKQEEKGGPDMFGVIWEWVQQVGGSMVRPGKHLFGDVNEWKEHVKLPDPDSWDWEGNVERVKCLIDDRRLRKSTIPTGLYERMISFMDFEDAVMSLIDEDQKEAVHELLDALCGVYEKIIANMVKYIKIDMLEFHDDWGSQRAPFFSLDTIEEMIVPHLRRICDYAHSLGLFVNFHSCGKNESIVPAMIDAHVDLWIPQEINDTDYLLEHYGDKLMIGVDPDVIKPGTPDDVVCKMAHDFVVKHIDHPRLFVFKSPSRHMGKHEYELYFNELYKESRRLLAEKTV